MPRDNLETMAVGALLIAPLALMLAASQRWSAAECAGATKTGGRGGVVVAESDLDLDMSDETSILEAGECPLDPTGAQVWADTVTPVADDQGSALATGAAPEAAEPEDGAEDLMVLRSASGLPLFLARGGDLVLSSFPETGWGRGPVGGGVGEERLWARRAVAPERVPAAMGRASGQEVVVHGIGGATCAAKVGALALYAEEYIEDEWGRAMPTTRAGRRARVNEAMTDPLALVASLEGPRPCGDGIAWPAEAPAPIAYVRAAMDPKEAAELRSSVTPQLAAEPEFALLRRAYREYRRELPAAWRAETDSFSKFVDTHLQVHSWQQQGGDRELLIVELRDRGAVCGEGFDGRAVWLFEVGDGELRRLPREVDFDITVLLGEVGVEDENGESLRWMIGGDVMGETLSLAGEPEPGGWEGDVTFQVPVYGCPC